MTSDSERQTRILRFARPGDGPGLARVYVESWRETYPGLLPDHVLVNMSPAHQAAQWEAQIRTAGTQHAVLVIDLPGYGIAGLASLGHSRDRGLVRYTGEVYALYVDPNYQGRGLGSALLTGAFRLLAERGYGSAVIWALAGNPARFFYEAKGGRTIAERDGTLGGAPVREVAFGWDNLAASFGGQRPPRGG